MFEGVLQKMNTEGISPVQYYLVFDADFLHLNSFLEKKFEIHHAGYQCLSCGVHQEIFRQGMCKKCFFEQPSVGDWVMHPELSKAHLGIQDRDLEYEKSVQLQPHIVYLANSSEVKVGVTRKTQVPTRWIDQGAHQAIFLAEVPNRYLAGITEVALKNYISDKTNWRKMLTNSVTQTDLVSLKTELKKYIPQEVIPFYSEENSVIEIQFPVQAYPQKVTSLNLKKTPFYSGVLKGIKGQYLIFEDGVVFNVRSHEGFRVKVTIS